jgi:hypothetical protein
MGQTRLPAHVRRLLAPHKAKLPKRRKPNTARSALMRAAGVDSELELILANRLERAGLPLGETQHRFVPGRQFRFDRAWPAQMVAVEVQGGVWSQNGHARPSMVDHDCVKFSIAAAFGWRVLPVTKEMIESGQAVELIRQALGLDT